MILKVSSNLFHSDSVTLWRDTESSRSSPEAQDVSGSYFQHLLYLCVYVYHTFEAVTEKLIQPNKTLEIIIELKREKNPNTEMADWFKEEFQGFMIQINKSWW